MFAGYERASVEKKVCMFVYSMWTKVADSLSDVRVQLIHGSNRVMKKLGLVEARVSFTNQFDLVSLFIVFTYEQVVQTFPLTVLKIY